MLVTFVGCATPVPSAGGETGADAGGPVVAACPDGKAHGASVDALGRLVTGPGLCSVEGGLKNVSLGHHVRLELGYDELGRPVQAVAEFSEVCKLGGAMSGIELSCEDFERQEQRWIWGEQGQLAAVERTIELHLDGDNPEAVTEYACFLGDAPFTVETVKWDYDEHGRVVTSAWTYADCEGTERVEERLRYTEGIVEARTVVTGGGESSSYASRYELDGCGRVVHEETVEPSPSPGPRYAYDDRGRLTGEDGPDRQRRWTYAAGIAAHPELRWVVEQAMDRRTVSLAQDRPGGDQFELRFDERQRVISVESQGEAWTLGYDDCPNAAFATAHWRANEVLATWSFPTSPQAGEGNAALDAWLHAELPLLPEALE
ncbi:RHS Repeat protein [Enhygromyxa salina]|uniref:RHS Repeat protein n=2 Tax=Enhygromyxa salina TaxID=215803 RepID=A0A2S9XZK4_9BACT|nr:RHS Repeat protein [Enhygromyxa salina]